MEYDNGISVEIPNRIPPILIYVSDNVTQSASDIEPYHILIPAEAPHLTCENELVVTKPMSLIIKIIFFIVFNFFLKLIFNL